MGEEWAKKSKPVCWRILKEQLRAIHLQQAYVEVHHVLRQHVHDRYYRRRKSSLKFHGMSIIEKPPSVFVP